jgi:hypothetical protein
LRLEWQDALFSVVISPKSRTLVKIEEGEVSMKKGKNPNQNAATSKAVPVVTAKKKLPHPHVRCSSCKGAVPVGRVEFLVSGGVPLEKVQCVSCVAKREAAEKDLPPRERYHLGDAISANLHRTAFKEALTKLTA